MVRERILCAVLITLSLSSPSRAGPAIPVALQQLSVTDLKAVYLGCERSASRSVLGPGDAATCSIAFEELKRRAFDGNFENFLTWWRAQAQVNVPAP
jgi:hypothetical protein